MAKVKKLPKKNIMRGFKKKYTLLDLFDIIKDGPKTNAAEDLDEVVYGDVNRT